MRFPVNESTSTAPETARFTLPAESPTAEAGRWRDRLLTFYLAGGDSNGGPLPQPAVVQRLADLELPVYLEAGESPAISSLADLLPSPNSTPWPAPFVAWPARAPSPWPPPASRPERAASLRPCLAAACCCLTPPPLFPYSMEPCSPPRDARP